MLTYTVSQTVGAGADAIIVTANGATKYVEISCPTINSVQAFINFGTAASATDFPINPGASKVFSGDEVTTQEIHAYISLSDVVNVLVGV